MENNYVKVQTISMPQGYYKVLFTDLENPRKLTHGKATKMYKIWSSTFSVKPRQNIFKSIVQFDFAKVTKYMFLSIFKYYVLHSSIDWNISSRLNTPDNFYFNIYGRIKGNFGCFDFIPAQWLSNYEICTTHSNIEGLFQFQE